jgi:hypothetical protein
MPDVGHDAGADVLPDVASETPPECVITAPQMGETHPFFTELTFEATASDAEDGDLDGDRVVWSSDLGGELGSGVSLTTRLAPAGEHTVRCTATDSAGNSASDEVSVTIVSPVARILHPGDGETRHVNTEIPFIGRGGDVEDGDLGGASLVWTSDLDGEIGTGPMLSVPLTTVGTHTITLTVTDGDQNTDETSITLELAP